MTTKNIAIVVGSLAKESVNKKLAEVIANDSAFPGNPIFVDIDLPLYSEDYDNIENNPGSCLKRAIEAADGVVFVTPEYNHSFSGATKNAIDWLSRPWGDNSLDGKPVMIASASPSPNKGAFATTDLFDVLEFMNADIVEEIINIQVTPETYDETSDEVKLKAEEERTALKEALKSLGAK